MDAEQLRALQSPLKERYRNEPDSALKTLRASGTLNMDDVTCVLETPRGSIVAGLHPATGGDGRTACSADMLLESLVACAGVTMCAVATALGVNVRGGRVTAEGDLDFRGTLGVSKDVPIGLKEIRLRFEIDSDATEEQRATLMKLTERYCVIYQTLRQPLNITSALHTLSR
jgi:uncharacterized OsmC-like protein